MVYWQVKGKRSAVVNRKPSDVPSTTTNNLARRIALKTCWLKVVWSDAVVNVTVTKIFIKIIIRFLLKDRKCSTKSFTYVQRSPD